MPFVSVNNVIMSVMVSILFSSTCEAIKCYDCNSANNSACLDLHLSHMHTIVPVVGCAQTLPNAFSKKFFCRKITQTILHPNRSPEVRVTRGCGWVKHRRECYTADNKDHLETVCQCFGDMCNAATSLKPATVTALGVVTVLHMIIRSWEGTSQYITVLV